MRLVTPSLGWTQVDVGRTRVWAAVNYRGGILLSDDPDGENRSVKELYVTKAGDGVIVQ